jgi:hypothetical protein
VTLFRNAILGFVYGLIFAMIGITTFFDPIGSLMIIVAINLAFDIPLKKNLIGSIYSSLALYAGLGTAWVVLV